MRSIAIIGSGQAGLLAAHGLLKAGYRVTLYTDRSPEQWLLGGPPTGAATRFALSLGLERELGLDHWHREAPQTEGVHLTLCPSVGNRLLTLSGRTREPFLSIDLRLQCHRWMKELPARGGKVELTSVSVERLEEIAAGHELTVVAAGRGALSRLFERDEARSTHQAPPRHLALMLVKGVRHGFEGVPMLPVKVNFLAPVGETFSVPYFHKDVGPCWSTLFEAKPGGPMDRFQEAKSAEEVVALGKKVFRELLPWEAEWFKDAEPADAHGWLVGRFTPVVRKPVGRLPSGRPVLALGDTAMLLDPVGGQGANNGNKMVRNLLECVAAHEDRPFDEAWMTATFERFYARHGHWTHTFNNLLLEPPTPAGMLLFAAQYGSDGRPGNRSGAQRVANALVENFNDPALLTPAFLDARKANQFIARATGRGWPRAVAAGGVGIARAGLRQWLGLEPGHPLVPGYSAG